jgi:hypothetical protein
MKMMFLLYRNCPNNPIPNLEIGVKGERENPGDTASGKAAKA